MRLFSTSRLSSARRGTRLAAVAAAASALLLVTAAVPAGAASATAVTVTGGKTSSVSAPGLGQQLLLAGIVPLPVDGAQLAAIDLATITLTIDLPISGGTLDPAAFFAGNIQHRGGLRFIRLLPLRTVTVSDFNVIVDANPRLIAKVNGGRRTVTLFTLDLSGLQLGGGTNQLTLGNVGLLMTEEGATLLNRALATRTFKAGMKFATATTDLTFSPPPAG